MGERLHQLDQDEGQHRRLRVERADRAAEHQRGGDEARSADKLAIGRNSASGKPGGGRACRSRAAKTRIREADKKAEADQQEEDGLPAEGGERARPPTVGAMAGLMAIMMPIRFMILEASAPVNWSRTMARAIGNSDRGADALTKLRPAS